MQGFEIVMIFPIITIALIALFFIYYIKVTRPRAGTAEWITRAIDTPRFEFKRYPLERRDILPMIILTVAFAGLAVFAGPYFSKFGWLPPLDIVYNFPAWFISSSEPIYEMLFPNEQLLASIISVAILPVFYCLMKNMFGKTAVAVCGTLLLGFEFVRLVFIDSLSAFFILLSYYFIYRYITTREEAAFKTSLFPFMISGVFFGLAVTSGWEALVSGIGLLAIYAIHLIILGCRWGETERSSTFGRYLVKTLLFGILSFVVIPAVIYVSAYIIVYNMLLDRFSAYNYYVEDAFRTLQSTIAFHYRWQEHNVVIQQHNLIDALIRNPFVLLGGVLATITTAVRSIKFRDFRALFVLVGAVSISLLWMFNSRTIFLYHHFISVIFFSLALTYVINMIFERGQKRFKQASYGFVIATGVVFAIFYPALTEFDVPEWYFRYFIHWFPNWLPYWPF